MAKRLGLETLFVLTEPHLANHFARLGVKIRQIGGAVEHRGELVPSLMSVTAIQANLPRPVRPLYEVISDAIRSGVEAQNPGLAQGCLSLPDPPSPSAEKRYFAFNNSIR